jgi:hypothetical protein
VSIQQRKVVDFVGIRRADGRCTLTISDHLPWDDPAHVAQLEDKLNDYLAFIEAGELYERFPDARGREIEIQIICKHMPPEDDVLPFLDYAAKKVRGASIHFAVRALSQVEHHAA